LKIIFLNEFNKGKKEEFITQNREGVYILETFPNVIKASKLIACHWQPHSVFVVNGNNMAWMKVPERHKHASSLQSGITYSGKTFCSTDPDEASLK
jgi:hypothetical protein